MPSGARVEDRSSADAGGSIRLALGSVLLVCLFVFLEVQPYRLSSGARITYPVFVLVSLAVLIGSRQRLLHAMRSLTWPTAIFGTYLLWIIVSTFWSYHPFTSLSQSAPLVAAFLIAVCFSSGSTAVTAKSLVIVGIAVALCSWIMFLVYPPSAVIPDVVWRLNGPLMHSQRLALLMGMSLIALVSLLLNREPSVAALPKYLQVIGVVMLAGTLLATNARAFTAFAFVTIALLVFIRIRPQARVLVLVVAALTLALVALSWHELYGLLGRGSRDVTLTGRIPLWEFTLDLIVKRPLQGFGFATFGTDLTRAATSVWIAPHAHNTWVNAAFETGIIGAALLTAFFAACLVVAIRGSGGGSGSSSYLLGPTVFAILCGSMGLVAGGRLTAPYALLLLLAAQAAEEDRRTRHPARSGT